MKELIASFHMYLTHKPRFSLLVLCMFLRTHLETVPLQPHPVVIYHLSASYSIYQQMENLVDGHTTTQCTYTTQNLAK